MPASNLTHEELITKIQMLEERAKKNTRGTHWALQLFLLAGLAIIWMAFEYRPQKSLSLHSLQIVDQEGETVYRLAVGGNIHLPGMLRARDLGFSGGRLSMNGLTWGKPKGEPLELPKMQLYRSPQNAMLFMQQAGSKQGFTLVSGDLREEREAGPHLKFHDEQGRTRLEIGIDTGGNPFLRFLDEKGETLWRGGS